MTASSRRRVFVLAVLVGVAAAVGLGSYLIVADGRTEKSAKEGGKGAGTGRSSR
jgi:nitrous oxide reductase